MAYKRKKVVLSIQDKLELIKAIENGASNKQMSLCYGVVESTVRGIMRQKDKLIQFASSPDNSSTMTRRKTMKNSTYEELDTALLEWINQVRNQGSPISGPIIAEKAKMIFKTLRLEGNFVASSGWLTRFKNRHGLSSIGQYENPIDDEQTDIQSDFEQFQESEDLTYEQENQGNLMEQNATDEFGSFWKCLPTQTLEFDTEKQAAEQKLSKEQLKTVTCSTSRCKGNQEKTQVSHDQALGYINRLIQYLEEQDDASLREKIILKKFQSKIKKKCFNRKKQKR